MQRCIAELVITLGHWGSVPLVGGISEKPHRMHLRIVPVTILGYSHWLSASLSCGIPPRHWLPNTCGPSLLYWTGFLGIKESLRPTKQRHILVDTWDGTCHCVELSSPLDLTPGGRVVTCGAGHHKWPLHMFPITWPVLSPAHTSVILFSFHYHCTHTHPLLPLYLQLRITVKFQLECHFLQKALDSFQLNEPLTLLNAYSTNTPEFGPLTPISALWIPRDLWMLVIYLPK